MKMAKLSALVLGAVLLGGSVTGCSTMSTDERAQMDAQLQKAERARQDAEAARAAADRARDAAQRELDQCRVEADKCKKVFKKGLRK